MRQLVDNSAGKIRGIDLQEDAAVEPILFAWMSTPLFRAVRGRVGTTNPDLWGFPFHPANPAPFARKLCKNLHLAAPRKSKVAF